MAGCGVAERVFPALPRLQPLSTARRPPAPWFKDVQAAPGTAVGWQRGRPERQLSAPGLSRPVAHGSYGRWTAGAGARWPPPGAAVRSLRGAPAGPLCPGRRPRTAAGEGSAVPPRPARGRLRERRGRAGGAAGDGRPPSGCGGRARPRQRPRVRREGAGQPEPPPVGGPGSLLGLRAVGAVAAEVRDVSPPPLAPTRSCDGGAGRARLGAGVGQPESGPLLRERPERGGERRGARREGSGQPCAGGEPGGCAAAPHSRLRLSRRQAPQSRPRPRTAPRRRQPPAPREALRTDGLHVGGQQKAALRLKWRRREKM
ncbi:translation initiation factor IF-2-like [Falco rusticolus]|uniref:translation initiation factor IF-2-like n=1 Tax=Falco rusticolus TaxID=120794 RepID=UPI0018868823|nr:translation initiation factor IF-2-like [Falco rusticolus]